MDGVIAMELVLDVGGKKPVVCSLQGELDNKAEMESIYSMIASYVVQSRIARERMEKEKNLVVC